MKILYGARPVRMAFCVLWVSLLARSPGGLPRVVVACIGWSAISTQPSMLASVVGLGILLTSFTRCCMQTRTSPDAPPPSAAPGRRQIVAAPRAPQRGRDARARHAPPPHACRSPGPPAAAPRAGWRGRGGGSQKMWRGWLNVRLW